MIELFCLICFVIVLAVLFRMAAGEGCAKAVATLLFLLFILSIFKFCSDYEKEERERKEKLDKAVEEVRKTKQRYIEEGLIHPPKM